MIVRETAALLSQSSLTCDPSEPLIELVGVQSLMAELKDPWARRYILKPFNSIEKHGDHKEDSLDLIGFDMGSQVLR